ncbi:hypothetical protein V2P53_03860 [Mycoplasma capricolum subsp. capricolum]|uniref:MAG4940 family membrane protein n=1 Tax=Mycoplasma capricolum TaxID=2095 RepID=UPI003DA1CEEB
MIQKNTPGEALRTFFNPTVFGFEILAVFLLVFLVLVFKLIAILLKKQHNKLFLSTSFTIATALAFFLPYGFASIGAKTSIAPFLNPLIVFFRAVFIGFGKSGQENNQLVGSILTNGIWYILFAQFIGAILSVLVFYLFFYSIKKINKNKIEYQFLNTLTLRDFFKNSSDLSVLGFSIKEFVFIILLIIVLPFISMIDIAIYRFDQFGIILIELLFIWTILFISSFFEFFSFHLAFPFIDIIFKTIDFVLLEKSLKKEQIKNYFLEILKFILVVLFSIIIPIVIGFVSILIKIQTGIVISVS